jgi:predicted DNA-binding antitoxin AbrB/MazE fold protein
MVETIEAIYDGKVLRPENPLTLEPNTRVRVTVEILEPATHESASFLDTAQSLNLDGPPDWAENIDSYLYGGERRHER